MNVFMDENLPPVSDLPVKENTNFTKYIAFAVIFILLLLSSRLAYETRVIFEKVIDFLILKGFLFFCIFFISLFYFMKFYKFKRMIADLPTSKIRSASMGMVELKGVAKRKYNLISPAANLPCIYYRVKKYRKASRDETSAWSCYETIRSGAVPFYIQDESGRACIYPSGAVVYPLKKESYINIGGTFSSGININVPLNEKWEEELILDNSPLYVLGWAEYPLQEERSEIKNIRLNILRQIKHDKDLLMKYDKDKNGVVDQYEWEKAVSDADKIACKKYLQKPAGASSAFIVLEPPYKGLPMVIASTRIEEKILKKYSFLFGFNLVLTICSFVLGSVFLIGAII